MIISKTPLRLSFFSGGSDMPSYYKNHGRGNALNATINKYIYVMRHETGNLIETKFDTVESYAPDQINTMKHVITRETIRYFKELDKGMSISSMSDIRSSGSGLGSSSAFTVGLCKTFTESNNDGRFWYGDKNGDIAHKACVIEIERCGFPIGKQDQYAAACGGFNIMEFQDNENVAVYPIKLSTEQKEKLNDKLLLVYSGKGRNANNLLDLQSKAASSEEKLKLIRRNRQRVFEGHEYLITYKYNDFGYLLHESWMDKKATVEGISDKYLDSIYDTAIDNGALGGKVLGAGGGGFMIFYCPHNLAKKNVIDSMLNFSEVEVHDFKFSNEGSRIIYDDRV